jgi:hypothetical protein
MNHERPSRWLPRLLFAANAVLAALAAFAFCYVYRSAPSSLFGSPHSLNIFVALLVFSFVAWAARRAMVGKAKDLRFTGRSIIAFVLFKGGLLTAFCVLVIVWLGGAIAKWSLATVFIRAAILLLLLNMVIGIVGGAAINSMLVIRRARQRVPK